MSNMNTSRQMLGFAGWLLLCLATGGLGALASVDAAEFYAQLVRPAWAPPAWLFGPAWTLLFLLMATAAWLVWRKDGFRGARSELRLFIFHLGVNALWSWLFFYWKLGAASFAEVLVLWVFIVATLVAFWRQNRLAGVLLLPYLAWVTFASALNFVCWRLNPGLL